jgi:hypothetical protein
MPDGESQSAITRKLNRLAVRRMQGRWAQPVKDQMVLDLRDPSKDAGYLAGTPVNTTDSFIASGVPVTVAPRALEQQHIRAWPLLQLAAVREAIAFAIENDIQIVYDWEPRPGQPAETSIKISPDVICITFKSPPE